MASCASPRSEGEVSGSDCRSRSRSPYRERRGSKRPHEDDHHRRRDRVDPRRFKVHAEDRRDRRDRDRHDYDSRGDRYGYHRRRSPDQRDRRDEWRSRSPPKFSDRRSGGAGKNAREQSVSDRGHPPSATASSSAKAETVANQTRQVLGHDHEQVQGMAKAKTETADFSVAIEESDGITLEALREQKRKKWEAIRARHRPLLEQALDTTTSNTPSEGQSESASAPRTPKSRSSSPLRMVDFSRDSELANSHVRAPADPDEPSAAEYDPSMDMQDDQRRREVANEVVRKTAFVPLKTTDPASASPTTEEKDEFDMFADGDDEDMFALKSNADAPVPDAAPITKALNVDTIDDWDDVEGYYKVILGELLDGRYHVQSNLGKGMFSGVVRAKDQLTGKLVAIKLIRSNETMRKAAVKEISILEKLKQADPDDRKHVVRLERVFEHKRHLCMVFENLNENLREVLKKFGRDIGIELSAVRVYAAQIFKGLSLLRKCNIMHADLKPDNILVNERRNWLKICDLGSAADASDAEITPYLVSRFYRAPEIILGIPYDFAIDTWSIGCTLFELYTGKILFTGRTNNQMLRSIIECRGRFSTKLLRKAEFAMLHFDEQGVFRSVEGDKVRMLNNLRPFRDLRTRLGGGKELNSFIDLLDKCLNLNPEKRITPAEALKHPFLTKAET